jgi:transcriptional regulator with XRE-family HTH domain
MTLRQYLKSRKLTQVQFARMVGVDPNTVWRWLHGWRRPSRDLITRLHAITCGEIDWWKIKKTKRERRS